MTPPCNSACKCLLYEKNSAGGVGRKTRRKYYGGGECLGHAVQRPILGGAEEIARRSTVARVRNENWNNGVHSVIDAAVARLAPLRLFAGVIVCRLPDQQIHHEGGIADPAGL